MKSIAQLLNHELASALGWTLIHSLWIGGLVLLIIVAVLRCIPTPQARLRYAVSTGGLVLLVASATVTLLVMFTETTGPVGPPPDRAISVLTTLQPAVPEPVPISLDTTSTLLQQQMPWLVLAWMVGILFFAFRFMGGLIYTSHLRSTAVPVRGEWSRYLQRVAQKLGIQKLVSLAESALITTPVVIGHLRPVILIPVGMFTGMSPEQVETIILHELAHVRRHDYLINLVQKMVETLFFFNPFVWSLSAIIRREREYCCDDIVLSHHGSPRAYAHALTLLAEKQLSGHAFALSLAEDRNQLLTRIKRIMKTSMKNSAGTRMVVPLILLIAGLFSISWLGIQAPDQEKVKRAYDTSKDSVIRKKENGARYSRKSIITMDENGQPHEEVIEEFEGDEALRPLLQKRIPPALHPSFIVPLPPGPSADVHRSDTIPPRHGWSAPKWENFSRDLEENLRKEFELLQELFEIRGTDSVFMKQFENEFGIRHPGEWMKNFDFPFESFEEQWMFEKREGLKDLERELQRMHDPDSGYFRSLQESLRKNIRSEYHMPSLREALTEDGYLSEDETIERLEWSNDGFKVNGKEVKKEHGEKYRRWFESTHKMKVE